MSKFLRVPDGDYKIQTRDGGSITLFTGESSSPNPGQVRISGNLLVEGTTTTLESEQLQVKDNIITVNQGETGSGITGVVGSVGKAGLEFDRGNLSNAQFFFDESVVWYDFDGVPADPGAVGNKNGGFIFTDEQGNLVGIRTNSITTGGGNLYLISNGTGVVSVSGTTNYESQVVDDDDIPNKKYVDDAVLGSIGISKITQGSISESKVEVIDEEFTGSPSKIVVNLDGTLTSTFYEDYVEIQDVKFENNEISPRVIGSDLILSAGSNSVLIDNTLAIKKLPNQFLVPPTPLDGVKIYAGPQSIGGTGIYFVNEDQTRDELVSRSKSILYGIIF